MTKIYFYLIIFLFLIDCSLNPNSKFWTKEKKILIDKSSAIILVKGPEKSLNEFNQNFKISIPKNLKVETNKQLNNDGGIGWVPYYGKPGRKCEEDQDCPTFQKCKEDKCVLPPIVR